MLDELDVLYKTETGRKIVFFHQVRLRIANTLIPMSLLCAQPIVEESEEDVKVVKSKKQQKVPETQNTSSNQNKMLFISDGLETPLMGVVSYFLRLTTRRALGEETFQVVF